MNLKKVKDTRPISYGYYDGLIPKGCVTIIAGQGEAGKSTLMCYLAETLSRIAKTIIVSNEEDAGIISGRIRPESDVTIASFSQEDNHRKITPKELLDVINDFDLIFVDSLVTFNEGKDINKSGTAEAFLTPFVAKVVDTNKALVFLHHTNKGGGDTLQDIVSGSERLVSGVRHCKVVINDKLNGRRFLCVAKDNTGMKRVNLEIIGEKLRLPDGGDMTVIRELVPTPVDIEKIIYMNSRESKRKKWDREIFANAEQDAEQIETPPEIIRLVLMASKGKPVDRYFISEQTGRYQTWNYAVNKTGNKWVYKTKNGREVTYHFNDLSLEWLEHKMNNR